MATSGYSDVNVTSWDTLRFSWSRSSYSIADNTSTISWSLQLISGSYGTISSSASKSWSVNVNGTAYSGTNTISIGNNTTKTLASGSTSIAHNNDGTKSFTYSFSQQFSITFSNSYIGTINGSGTGTLETIPRTSSISMTDANIESVSTITISRASSSFTHTLRYGFGTLSGTIVDKTSDTTVYWTLPSSFYSQIPSATIGEGYVACDTYSGSTLVGTSTRLFLAYVDENSNKPTLNPSVIDQGSLSTVLTGDPNTIIKNFNTVNVSFNASARNSASISSMKVVCGSKSKTSDGQIENADSGVFTFTVTDSRGYVSTETVTKETIDYIPLSCYVSASPTLVDGSSAKVDVLVSGNYFDGSFGDVSNSITVEYRYKLYDSEYPTDNGGNDIWTEIIPMVDPIDGKYTANTTITGLDYTHTYVFQARAKDRVNTGYVNAIEQVVRVVPIFDWGKNDFNFNVPVHSKGGFTEDIKVVDNGNCNEMLTSGRYYIGSNGSNKPGSGENGWLTVQSYGSGYCYQEYVTSTGIKYYRMQDENNWGTWILTDGGMASTSITTKPWAAYNVSNFESRTYYRVGNIVFMYYAAIYQTDGTTTSFSLVEQEIPIGYRPVNSVVVTYAQVAGLNVTGYARWWGKPDGTSSASLTSTGFTEHIFSTSWFTNDAFPA